MNIELLNGANLAFIGDAYYELYIRKYCLNKGITNQKELHKECVKFVSAHAHALIYEKISENNILNDMEKNIFKRGRNHHFKSNRKNINPIEYAISSGFESLIGYLYLKEDFSRLDDLLKFAIEVIENNE